MFRFRSATNSSASSIKSVDHGPVIHTPIMTPPTEYDPILSPALDEEQEKKLIEFKEWMETIILDKEDPYYPSERGFLTEETAKRYLRARKWEMDASKTMLENTVKWRRDFKPDMLDAEAVRCEAETGKMYFSGYDKTGRPLWIMKPRYENSKDSDKQVKYIVFCLERGIRLMPAKVEKLSIVVDFKDSSKASNPSISTCKQFLDILSNHYPERLGVAFLFNSPWFFLTTFKLIAPFIDPVTRNKIKFINKNDSSKAEKGGDVISVEECIPLDTMEVDLGGKYNFGFDIDTYWPELLEKTGNPYKFIDYR